jgi:hypothetical protein
MTGATISDDFTRTRVPGVSAWALAVAIGTANENITIAAESDRRNVCMLFSNGVR